MRVIRWPLLVLHAILAIGALAAGQALARDPSGAPIGLSVEWLQGSPFPDYRVPGLFLVTVIGSANLASTLLLGLRHPLAPFISLGTGILLVTWLAIQTAIIGFRHWSQTIWWVLFPLVALLAAVLTSRRAQPDG